MKILTGTDIIEIGRIQESIESLGEKFKHKIYTEKEMAYCESKKNMKFQHYAGRFAAKEAIFKAISELLDDKFEIAWTEVEILNDANGKPRVTFQNQKIQQKINMLDLSISHCKEYAVANVVVTYEEAMKEVL